MSRDHAVSLGEVRQELIDVLQENFSIIAARHALNRLGEVLEKTAACFQSLGICNLLLSADMIWYHRNLVYSALTRRWFLARCHAEGDVQDEHLAISRCESFFDAVAAKMLPLAREIADMSTSEWIPDGEYEDDFCYFAFLHRLVLGSASAGRASLELLLDRFERVVAGETTPRLQICRAFLDRKPELFAEAFQALLDGRELELKRQLLSDDPTAEPRRHVFVEGLGLLHFATELGFETAPVYQFCPDLARTFPALPMPENIYDRLDREFPRS